MRSVFIEKVKKNLVDFGVLDVAGNLVMQTSNGAAEMDGRTIGVGVSGGADSVSLFLVLSEILCRKKKSSENEKILKKTDAGGEFSDGDGGNISGDRLEGGSESGSERLADIPLVVVTVNHHIRSDEESNGDADFVRHLVEKHTNGQDIRLVAFDLEAGQVRKEASRRKCGIEEAARFLRYECFEKAILENNIAHFCLAHNQDDNLETILMRFLQGSKSFGISPVREKYVRPLINITRNEIEGFLAESFQDWRTDKSNFDDNYLRNNIRLNLVPVLDRKFAGWRTAILNGAKKSKVDNDFISAVAENVRISPSIEASAFEHDAIAYRVLLRALNDAGVPERIPSRFLEDVILEVRKSLSENRRFSKRFSNVEILCENRNVFVKKHGKKQTDFGFFDIIRGEGTYDFPFGELVVSKSERRGFLNLCVNGKSAEYEIGFPFSVRSPCLGEKKLPFVIEEASENFMFSEVPKNFE